jgi:hypothetical protein
MNYLRQEAPERTWNATKVRRLISQRSYLGETRNGTIVQAGTHEPLVSRAVWEAAQSTPGKRQPAAHYPLSGIMRCGTCSTPMTGHRGGRDAIRLYACPDKTCQRRPVITAEIVENYLREVLRKPLAGLRARISDAADSDTLALLERTLHDAEAELDAFASDLTLRKALSDRYHRHLQERVGAVDRARAAYRDRARSAQATVTLELADLEQDPQLFPLLLRNVFESIVVLPGRRPVADRVRLVPLHGDVGAGMADAQRGE